MPKDINALLKGYKEFHEHYYGDATVLFDELVRHGQRPKILVVACSDSRVDPALVLNAQPGDLFVIRNVANLIPPFEDDQGYHGTSAALEFGIRVLGIRHLILFGHTQCGGIQSLIQANPQPGCFIAKWMELAEPARKEVMDAYPSQSLDEQTTLCGQYSLVNSLKNLMTFPWIQEKVQEGSLFLHAWNFDLSRGMLKAYDPEENRFKDIELN